MWNIQHQRYFSNLKTFAPLHEHLHLLPRLKLKHKTKSLQIRKELIDYYDSLRIEYEINIFYTGFGAKGNYSYSV